MSCENTVQPIAVCLTLADGTKVNSVAHYEYGTDAEGDPILVSTRYTDASGENFYDSADYTEANVGACCCEDNDYITACDDEDNGWLISIDSQTGEQTILTLDGEPATGTQVNTFSTGYTPDTTLIDTLTAVAVAGVRTDVPANYLTMTLAERITWYQSLFPATVTFDEAAGKMYDPDGGVSIAHFYGRAATAQGWIADATTTGLPVGDVIPTQLSIKKYLAELAEKNAVSAHRVCVSADKIVTANYQVSDFDSGDLVAGDPTSCTFSVIVDDPDATIAIDPVDGYTFVDGGGGKYLANFIYDGATANPQQPLSATITLATGETATLSGGDFYLCSGGGEEVQLTFKVKTYLKEFCYEGLPSTYQDEDGVTVDTATIELCQDEAVESAQSTLACGVTSSDRYVSTNTLPVDITGFTNYTLGDCAGATWQDILDCIATTKPDCTVTTTTTPGQDAGGLSSLDVISNLDGGEHTVTVGEGATYTGDSTLNENFGKSTNTALNPYTGLNELWFRTGSRSGNKEAGQFNLSSPANDVPTQWCFADVEVTERIEISVKDANGDPMPFDPAWITILPAGITDEGGGSFLGTAAVQQGQQITGGRKFELTLPAGISCIDYCHTAQQAGGQNVIVASTAFQQTTAAVPAGSTLVTDCDTELGQICYDDETATQVCTDLNETVNAGVVTERPLFVTKDGEDVSFAEIVDGKCVATELNDGESICNTSPTAVAAATNDITSHIFYCVEDADGNKIKVYVDQFADGTLGEVKRMDALPVLPDTTVVDCC